MVGGTKVVEKFRLRQKVIDKIDYRLQRQEAQQNLDSEIPKCFTSVNTTEKGCSRLLTDRSIANPNGDVVCQHAYLYPVRGDIPVTEFNKYALCEKPENEWTVCAYRFKTSAESVDLPDVPDGEVDVACLLLQHIDSSSSIAMEQRFLAAWLQYFIAYHWNTFQEHPNQIVSIGNGIVADLFVEAAKLLREQQKSNPYPTPELDCLITCAHNFTERSQLLILHFVYCLAVDAVHTGASATENLDNESRAAEVLCTCAKEYFTSCGYEISCMEVCVQNSLMLTCFCSPRVTKQVILNLSTNPLHTDEYTFELDGANCHLEKPVDIIQSGDEKVVNVVKHGDEKVVDEICLRVELLKLKMYCPEDCCDQHIPDRLYKIAVQCNGITKKGKRCKNKTLNAIGLCCLHKDQKECGYY